MNATVTSAGLNVRLAPGADATVSAKVYAGARLQVLSTVGAWAKVRLPDGREVYVGAKFLTNTRP